ncbi:MAG TPA: TetR family transcriptional regulator [Usitatibacter sp.]|jgi:TetR/AcrR family acrAB operon transcriptional repressor
MRRTKEEAARTREAILEGALACFDRYGITSATVEQIAREAGVTRGAVYHHFAGKRDILRAIRERVSLPLLDQADTALLRQPDSTALERIERFLLSIVDGLENDRRKRRALTVMQLRCEYVGELAGELAAGVRNLDRLAKALEGAYREAQAAGQLAPGIAPPIAALETIMFMNGLVRLWIVHENGGNIRRHAREAIAAHVRMRRARGRA